MRFFWSIVPFALALGGCVTTNPTVSSNAAATPPPTAIVVPVGTEKAFDVLNYYAQTASPNGLGACWAYKNVHQDLVNRAEGLAKTGRHSEAWAGFHGAAERVAACAVLDKKPSISISDAFDLAGGYLALSAIVAKQGKTISGTPAARKSAQDAITLLSVHREKNEDLIKKVVATGLVPASQVKK